MSEHRFAVGDKVICNPAEVAPRFQGVVYTIDRFGPVNAVLTPVAGGRGLRINPSALLPAPVDANGAPVARLPYTPPPPPLPIGAVVTVASPRWTGGNGLFTVLRDDGEKTNIAVLGGDGNRYWPKIPRTWLTPVDPDRLKTALAGLTTS